MHWCALRPAIEQLLRALAPPSTRQTVLFSATYPPDIRQVARLALRPGFQVVDTIGETEEQTAEKVGLCSQLEHPDTLMSTSK